MSYKDREKGTQNKTVPTHKWIILKSKDYFGFCCEGKPFFLTLLSQEEEEEFFQEFVLEEIFFNIFFGLFLSSVTLSIFTRSPFLTL